MNRNQFDKTERREVTEDDFEVALKAVFLAPRAASKARTGSIPRPSLKRGGGWIGPRVNERPAPPA